MPGLEALPTSTVLAGARDIPDRVADALRDAIARGLLNDGTELNQVALARHYGVSRVPIREALRQLQAEGFVRAERNQRTVVAGLSDADLMEILELRELLDGHLATRAASRVTASATRRLRATARQMGLLRGDQVERWAALHVALHTQINQLSGAVLTIATAQALAARGQRYLVAVGPGNSLDDARLQTASAEHDDLVDAVCSGDPEWAGEAAREHVARARARVATTLAQRRTP